MFPIDNRNAANRLQQNNRLMKSSRDGQAGRVGSGRIGFCRVARSVRTGFKLPTTV